MTRPRKQKHPVPAPSAPKRIEPPACAPVRDGAGAPPAGARDPAFAGGVEVFDMVQCASCPMFAQGSGPDVPPDWDALFSNGKGWAYRCPECVERLATDRFIAIAMPRAGAVRLFFDDGEVDFSHVEAAALVRGLGGALLILDAAHPAQVQR